MKALILLCGIAMSCAAQDVVKHGEQVFAKSCATGYCHGAKGTASGAPRLAGRGFNQSYIAGVVMRGIAAGGMPSFATTLSRADFTAVVAYVATLNGAMHPDVESTAEPAAPELTGEAARGQKLFFEAARSFGRCSTCHEVGGYGISVATPIGKVPENAAALKSLATPGVKTATMNGESMPALVLSDTKQGTLFYDLTSAPPVERNAEPGAVKFSDGSTWRHVSAIGGYSDAELDAILAYLRTTI
ncbi:MAG TPA: c-type cytochrome [Bryobacteraceae bacterium]|nr:c-type cytochrome [Bryobacteraceae bacterium]